MHDSDTSTNMLFALSRSASVSSRRYADTRDGCANFPATLHAHRSCHQICSKHSARHALSCLSK
jgi:hypothetical protein